nr:LuxR C-terminal-related transcriptional regulator [Nonomuraea ceibae]
MVGAQHPLPIGQHRLQQRNGPAQILHRIVGAVGYVLETRAVDELVEAIRLVHSRDALLFPGALRRIASPHVGTATPRVPVELTSRELDVLRPIALGQNNAEIAAALHVTRRRSRHTSAMSWASSVPATAPRRPSWPTNSASSSPVPKADP